MEKENRPRRINRRESANGESSRIWRSTPAETEAAGAAGMRSEETNRGAVGLPGMMVRFIFEAFALSYIR